MRPTIYIGLGGFGCAVIRQLKAKIKELSQDSISNFAFLGLDTQKKEITDILTNNEYVELSIGISPDKVAKSQTDFLNWYLELMGSYKARNITAGANHIKAVGRLAFRFQPTFNAFISKLNNAFDALSASKASLEGQNTIKVFIISTLAGGTGSGCLLDVFSVVGRFFESKLGPDFPYQAILVTPDVLRGEAADTHIPRLMANTYASLKEIHHIINDEDNLYERYDDGNFQNLRIGRSYVPNPLHLIGDRNENGTAIVRTIEELGNIVVSYLISDLRSPMKDKFANVQVQDMENVNVFDQLGNGDMPRAFSSFGVVRVGMPADIIEALFSYKLLHEVILSETLTNSSTIDEAKRWIDTNGLNEFGTDKLQLQYSAKHSKISVDARGEILKSKIKYDSLVDYCKLYLQKILKSNESYYRKSIQEESAKIIDRKVEILNQTINDLISRSSVGYIRDFIRKLEEALTAEQVALMNETKESSGILEKMRSECNDSINAVYEATKMWFGRKRSVEDAVGNFDGRLENLLNQQIDVWVKQSANSVYSNLIQLCKDMGEEWDRALKFLHLYKSELEATIGRLRMILDQMADVENRGPENRFSIVDYNKAMILYSEFFKEKEIPAIITKVRNKLIEGNLLGKQKLDFEQWSNGIVPFIKQELIKPKIKDASFYNILDKFYPRPENKKNLFEILINLSSPLFHLDNNVKESSYDTYWIIAVEESQTDFFNRNLIQFLRVGQGKIYTDFNNPFEIMLFQLKFGLTIHSFVPIHIYKALYDNFQRQYLQAIANKKQISPIHCWLGANSWPELIPNQDMDEAFRLFILGRAFNYLFPTGSGDPKDKDNTAYIFARGSNYYLIDDATGKKLSIGNGLANAINFFAERPDIQSKINTKIESKLSQIGTDELYRKLNDNYLPILDDEIRNASEIPGEKRDEERKTLLLKLKCALLKYINSLRRVGV